MWLTVAAIVAVAVGAWMWTHAYRTPPPPTDQDRRLLRELGRHRDETTT